jgi:hypothetical protein
MKEQPGNNKRVEEIMNSLDGLQPANTSPYLYTKIIRRLDQQESRWKTIASFLSRPVIAIGLSILLLLMNTWIILYNKPLTIDDKTDQLTALAQEYHFEQPTLLDQNINLP